MFSFMYTYLLLRLFSFFFFNDTATTEIYTLSLHDALPICIDLIEGNGGQAQPEKGAGLARRRKERAACLDQHAVADRKSTRLNSSHLGISYAVFCLKKKKKNVRKFIAA